AGIDTSIRRHTFRATGITDYLTNGGRIEVAQRMAGHSNAKNTRPLHRRHDDISGGGGGGGGILNISMSVAFFVFCNESQQEFAFGNGTYSLRRLFPTVDVPAGELPGLSQMDRAYIEREEWALVAADADPEVYKGDINLLLLSFKIHTLGRLFIKY